MKKIIEETEQYTFFIDYFKGNPIRFIYDKQRDELRIHGDDMFKALGYSGLFDFLGSENIQFILQYFLQRLVGMFTSDVIN